MIKTKDKNININKQLELVVKGINEFNKTLEILPRNFHKTFNYHYLKAKEKGIIKSLDELESETDVSEKTLRNYKEGKNVPPRINIIKIGLALKLPSQYMIDLLEKADCKMSLNNEDNTLLLTIIYGYSQVGLDQVYSELRQYNKEKILKISKK